MPLLTNLVLGLTLASVVTSEITSGSAKASSWYFYYDCSSPAAEGCSNVTSFCAATSRPQFLSEVKLTSKPNNGLLGATAPEVDDEKEKPVDDTEFSLGPFHFVTDDVHVAEIWSVGIFICLGITIWRFFRLADQHPELAKELIDGCVVCRSGKKMKDGHEVEMKPMGNDKDKAEEDPSKV